MDNIKATGEQISNAVLDNIYQRRSVRNYSDKEVPDEIIREIIRAGTYAPSAVNKQPWRFVVVKNRQLIDEYDDRARKVFLAAYGDTKKTRTWSDMYSIYQNRQPGSSMGHLFSSWYLRLPTLSMTMTVL